MMTHEIDDDKSEYNWKLEEIVYIDGDEHLVTTPRDLGSNPPPRFDFFITDGPCYSRYSRF